MSTVEILNRLRQQFGELISLENIDPNVMRIYAPFFHEDGDMMSMYLETMPDGTFLLRDFGNTLMRVSYTFDIDSDNKQLILNNIVKGNYGILDDFELQLNATLDSLPEAILQFSQLITKVSSIELLQRQTVKTMFFEYLDDFITTKLSNYKVSKQTTPSRDKQLVVDFQIDPPNERKPIYIFGVNENVKASKVVISCLNFQKQKLPFRSLVIHEDFGGLSSFYRNQITNAVDKQFTTLEDFKEEGVDYITRELAS